MRRVLGLAAMAMTLGLGACAGVDDALREDPLYQLGYNDGCSTASTSSAFSKPTRNREYAGKSEAYDAGWSNGFGSCGGNASAMRRGDVFEDDSHRGREQ